MAKIKIAKKNQNRKKNDFERKRKSRLIVSKLLARPAQCSADSETRNARPGHHTDSIIHIIRHAPQRRAARLPLSLCSLTSHSTVSEAMRSPDAAPLTSHMDLSQLSRLPSGQGTVHQTRYNSQTRLVRAAGRPSPSGFTRDSSHFATHSTSHPTPSGGDAPQ